MASLKKRVYVIRATQWSMDNGISGCTIYAVQDGEASESSRGYAISKIQAAYDVFEDFASGAGSYELELAADLTSSRPRLTCLTAKYLQPLTITTADSS